MDRLVKLAKSHSPNLMEQIYFMESIKTEAWSWRRIRMNKELMTNAVETLVKYLKKATEKEQIIFYKFLEGMCDTESKYYILGHLELLAEVLKENDYECLIDFIAKYDYKAAQILDVHMRELQ
ncbi:hypothetical protein POL82_04235 [Priestia aryabhattai]|uniref:hypothetical protein n=2 Tax=Priestia TaxID=2800373 RepID=UPI00234EDC2B|nr:hypothetical protein [Priestia aryabhattai]MDC7762657.1 hypothetical protein [Priestia aryabhattai]